MPIKIPNELPAVKTLTEENIFVMTETRAITQDIRPLKLLILNLMPTKIDTETQLSRLLGNSPLQVEIELMHTRTHVSRHTAEEHMLAFYQTFEDVRARNFDGMIITGAPVENLPFEAVEYWDELCEIMEWSKTHVHSTFHICWGAQAALYYHFGIPKHPLPQKLFGVFEHHVEYKPSITSADLTTCSSCRIPGIRRSCAKTWKPCRRSTSSPPPMKRASMRFQPKRATSFSSPAIRNTMPARWKRSTCAIRRKGFPSRCRKTIIPTMMIPAPRA